MASRIIPYASQTSGTNKRLLLEAGWRFMVSPDTADKNRLDPACKYALDNGAWGAFVRQRPWEEDRFLRLVDTFGGRADFVVIPDVVADAPRTLELADVWIRRLDGIPRYLALQDGMGFSDVLPFVARVAGFFLGGSTAWKLRSAAEWGGFCSRHGRYLHVGRVNTIKRIRLMRDAGAHSFDGSNASRFAKVKLPGLQGELDQQWLF